MASKKQKDYAGFLTALPWLMILLGVMLFLIGVYTPQEKPTTKEIFTGLGKTILAGGVFAALLKSIQFMGVFKSDLFDIVFEDKFLKTRVDIEEVWSRVSRVMFKNKFAKISNSLTNDIKSLYLPVDHVLYYDNYKQEVHINLLDEQNEIIGVKLISEYTIYPNEPKEKVEIKSTNTLVFNKNPNEVSYTINKFLVNSAPLHVVLKQVQESTCLRNIVSFSLKDSAKYEIESEVEKAYSLKYDKVMGQTLSYLINNYDVKFFIGKGIKCNFLPVGTLNKWRPGKSNSHSYQEWEYKGLIYPKQGWYAIVEKI